MATTAGDIITAAFSKIGIASPTAAQTASALISLNTLVSFFGADFMFPFLVRESFALTIGDYDYTIGTGGNFSTVRPIKIESCYLRDAESYDYPMIIFSPRDYARKANKTVTAQPSGLYYVPEFPYGKIYFDAAPERAYTAYFESIKNFTEFALTTTTFASVLLPDEYKAFFTYNLAISLAEDWDRTVNKTLYAMAGETKAVIERLIASTKPAPVAKFDTQRIDDSGTYSIVTDDYIDGGSF